MRARVCIYINNGAKVQASKEPRQKNKFFIQYGTKAPRHQGKGTKHARNQARKTTAPSTKQARNQDASNRNQKNQKNAKYFLKGAPHPIKKKAISIWAVSRKTVIIPNYSVYLIKIISLSITFKIHVK
jgi:leucyl-tRNA synthetase